MLELIDKNSKLFQAQVALKISRYKRKGYIVVGVGYPFFRNEYKGMIDICDWFADDLSGDFLDGWRKLYSINDITELQKIGKFVVVVLSDNRMSVLKSKRQIASTFRTFFWFEIIV